MIFLFCVEMESEICCTILCEFNGVNETSEVNEDNDVGDISFANDILARMFRHHDYFAITLFSKLFDFIELLPHVEVEIDGV